MTRAEAVVKLKKLYGEKFYYSVMNIITSPDMREQARAELQAAKAAKESVDVEIRAWLAEQPIYQEKMARKLACIKNVNAIERKGLAYAFRFTIGRNIGWANEVKGHGDTWEQAFAEAERKAKLA